MDPDETAHYMSSHLHLHCLHMYLYRPTELKGLMSNAKSLLCLRVRAYVFIFVYVFVQTPYTNEGFMKVRASDNDGLFVKL